jgi:hypothetical protein
VIYYKPGDIVLTRGTGFFARAIRFFSRRIGESRTMVNHVGIIVEGGYFPVLVEALRTVERRALLDSYGEAEFAVYRPINVPGLARKVIVATAEDYVGRKYGWLKIALHGLDWALQGAYVFRRLGRMDAYPICSYVVAHAYAAADLTFGVAPGAATPDDIWDFVRANPDKYELVKPLGVPLEVSVGM